MRTKVCALLIATAMVLSGACVKDTTSTHRLPTFTFRTDSSYTSANDTVGMLDTLKVGVVIDRTDDALRMFEVKTAYDGSLAQTTMDSVEIVADHFARDEQLIMRNVAGSEKWSFIVTLGDGNTVTRSLTFTVQ